jgi:hypothetical protein
MTTEERLKSSQSPLDNFLSDASQLATDTADAVADLATDAYQGMKAINQEYALGQRTMGALKMLGGAGEAFVGSIGIMTPEPLTSVGGGIIFVHGADVASSGFQEMLTGKHVETVTDQVATESAKLLGADDVTAQQIGDGVDMGLSLGSAGVGAYQALTRPVIAELGPMTIKSSEKVVPASVKGSSETPGNRTIYTVTADISKIAESGRVWGKTEGTVYGMAVDNAPRWRTSLGNKKVDPGKIVFEGQAADLFSKHPVEGIYSGIKRLVGQYKAPFGDIAFNKSTMSFDGSTLVIRDADVVPHAGQSTLTALSKLWTRRTLDASGTGGFIWAITPDKKE